MLAIIVWPPKLASILPSYVLLLQIIEGSYIFNPSLGKLANMIQDKKVGKHTPLKSGGLTYAMRRYVGNN